MIRRALLTAAAISVAGSPVLAQSSQPVRPSSATISKGAVSGITAGVRRGAKAEGSDLMGAPLLLLLAGLAAAAALVAVVAAQDSSSPN